MRLGLGKAGRESGRGGGSAAGGAARLARRAQRSPGGGSPVPGTWAPGAVEAESAWVLAGGRASSQVPSWSSSPPRGLGGGCPGAGPEGLGRTYGLATRPCLRGVVPGYPAALRAQAASHEWRAVLPKGSGGSRVCRVDHLFRRLFSKSRMNFNGKGSGTAFKVFAQ